jgi:hypothetical protein
MGPLMDTLLFKGERFQMCRVNQSLFIYEQRRQYPNFPDMQASV